MGSGTQHGRPMVHGNSRLLQPIGGNYAVGCAGGELRVGLQTSTVGHSPPPDRPLLGFSTHGAEACTTEGRPATAISGGGGGGVGSSAAEMMDSLQAAAELAALFSQQPSPPPATSLLPKRQQAPGLSGGLCAMSNDAAVYQREVSPDQTERQRQRVVSPARVTRPAPMVMLPTRSAPVAPATAPPPQGGDDAPEQQHTAARPADDRRGPLSFSVPQSLSRPTIAKRAPSPWEYSAEEDETPRQIAATLGISVKELVDANKARYKGLHQHAKLFVGTQLQVSGAVPKPPPRPPTVHKSTAQKPVATAKPKKPAAAAKPKASCEPTRPVAVTGEHAPEVDTAIGPVKLRTEVWVKWVDGDGEFYRADVTNVSKTRGVTVRYPDTADWAAWTEVLAISDITSERVRFEPGPRQKAKLDRARNKPSPEMDDETDMQSGASRRAPSSWSAAEDEQLLALIAEHGESDWAARAKDLGTNRTAKACQTRYRNHLRFRSEEQASGKRKLAVEGKGPGGNKRGRMQLDEDDALRRSSRAAALKEVSYNDDAAFEAMEADLESPAPIPAGSQTKRRVGGDASRGKGIEESESESDSSDSESDEKRQSKRRAGDGLISEAELERLRRQQLRWLRLQEEREAAEASKREEQERQRKRDEARHKAKEAKEQRKQAEAARRAQLAAERLKQQEDIDRAVAEDEEKLALVAEGSEDAPADDEAAKKAEQRLRAKQRGLMRLMKQLHVDAQAGLVAPERNGSSKVRASAPVRKFSPEKEQGRPQWSSSKLARVRSDSSSESDTEGGQGSDDQRDGQQKRSTKGVVAGGDRKAARESSPKSPETDMSPATSVAVAAPPEIANCVDDAAWDPLLGRLLEKSFEGHGLFRGTVTSYEDQSSPRVYTVRYEDGDEEDLEEHELAPLLLQAKHDKQDKQERSRGDSGKWSSLSPGESSGRRWDEYLVGSAIQYRLPFASGRGSKSEKQWMWLRGVVKRTCKSHTDWVHVAFDNSTSFDVQVLPTSRGTVWCIEPQR